MVAAPAAVPAFGAVVNRDEEDAFAPIVPIPTPEDDVSSRGSCELGRNACGNMFMGIGTEDPLLPIDMSLLDNAA